MFDGLYEKIVKKFPEVETVAVDAGYKTPWIMKQIIDNKRIPAVPYKRPMTKDGFFKKYEYVYDEYYNSLTFACMNLKKLATWKRRKRLLPSAPQESTAKLATFLKIHFCQAKRYSTHCVKYLFVYSLSPRQ